jgi:hypothetical protein
LGTAGGSAGGRVGVGAFSQAEPGVQFGYGLLGIANGPAEFNVGVFGSASGGITNWAAYFDGNTFTGGSGIIRQDQLILICKCADVERPARWSMATVTGGQFQIFNDFLGQMQFDPWANNNVGIGTTVPGSADVAERSTLRRSIASAATERATRDLETLRALCRNVKDRRIKLIFLAPVPAD